MRRASPSSRVGGASDVCRDAAPRRPPAILAKPEAPPPNTSPLLAHGNSAPFVQQGWWGVQLSFVDGGGCHLACAACPALLALAAAVGGGPPLLLQAGGGGGTDRRTTAKNNEQDDYDGLS